MTKNKENAGDKLHKLIKKGDWTGEKAYEYLLTIKKKKDIEQICEYRGYVLDTLLHVSTNFIRRNTEENFYLKISLLLLGQGVPFDEKCVYGTTPLLNCLDGARPHDRTQDECPGVTQLAMQLIDKGANFPHCINYAFKNNYLDIIEYYFNSLNINNIEQNEIHFKEAKDVPEHLYQRFISVREKLLLAETIENNNIKIGILKI